ncbi:unnamed protein product [Adineta ricciae]|uniref:Adenosine 3'-phospho 5'-phosphosulfate transporter 2 n=2 Tax=Adineta ricciae TaxID=249248 RepID=A0A814SR79_ADIRI|nr:unnamed protein product [Adineta ricciae]
MEISKIHQHQDNKPTTSAIEVTIDTDSDIDPMEYRKHEHTNYQTSSYLSFGQFSSPSTSLVSPRFIGLCFLVFLYYIGYAYLQELMFTLKGFDNTAWFLTCYQFFVYGILSFVHLGFAGLDQRRASYRSYILLALLTVTTMGLSNYAVVYLNYPTQVMFKCCKLIPVLIGGILIQRKTFNRYDVAAAFCMSTGLIFFTLADSKVQPRFNLYGVVIISLALIADAAIGNYQEKIMKEHHVSNVEIVFYSFIFGFVFVLCGLLLTNNFFPSLEFWNKHPGPTYGYGLIFSIVGYLGIDIVLTLIKEYGALICVTVTTCRKAITIILSFTLFSKPFVFDYLWSGLIVIVGIYLNVYSRNQTVFNAKIVSFTQNLFNLHWWPRLSSAPTIRTLPV